MKATLIMSLTTSLAIAGCTWVNENTAGKAVVITVAEAVTHCTQIGNISANTRDKIGFIPRSKSKVTDELKVLARNEAIKLGANTIVADGAPKEGKQLYRAFTCP